jgi:hypothetical protein
LASAFNEGVYPMNSAVITIFVIAIVIVAVLALRAFGNTRKG